VQTIRIESPGPAVKPIGAHPPHCSPPRALKAEPPAPHRTARHRRRHTHTGRKEERRQPAYSPVFRRPVPPNTPPGLLPPEHATSDPPPCLLTCAGDTAPHRALLHRPPPLPPPLHQTAASSGDLSGLVGEPLTRSDRSSLFRFPFPLLGREQLAPILPSRRVAPMSS
jgi:hypothetical protein